MTLAGCPTRRELDELATGRRVSRRARRHVARCARCKQVLEDLQRDAALIESLREAAALLADRETRDAIDICIETGRPRTDAALGM